VVKLTSNTDPMMEALANCLDILATYHKVSKEQEAAYAELLAEEKIGRLLGAVKGSTVREIAECGWEPVYRRQFAK
jgi:hypothetical protein